MYILTKTERGISTCVLVNKSIVNIRKEANEYISKLVDERNLEDQNIAYARKYEDDFKTTLVYRVGKVLQLGRVWNSELLINEEVIRFNITFFIEGREPVNVRLLGVESSICGVYVKTYSEKLNIELKNYFASKNIS